MISAQAFPPKPGGIQNLLAGTAEYIARAGHNVTVLADGDADAKSWDQKQHHPFKIERFQGLKPIRRRLKAYRIRKMCREHPVKAVYADTWKSIELLQKPPRVPVVSWAHGNEFPRIAEKGARIKAALSKADCVIFNSEETKERAKAFMPDHVPSIVVNPPIFDPVEASDADKGEADTIWQNATPRLLSMCRLIDWKGIDRAIEAMPAVLKHFPNAHYVIVGVGDDHKRLEALVEKHGLQNAVHFQGWVEEGLKTALLRSADLFLQPGRQVVEEREGYGISYVEAALQGLPTISGNAGGAPEAIIDGKTGFVVDARTITPVENAIISLLNDQSQHAAMREAARKHGETCLWNNQVKRVLGAAGL